MDLVSFQEEQIIQATPQTILGEYLPWDLPDTVPDVNQGKKKIMKTIKVNYR